MVAPPSVSHLTEGGIPGIRAIPYGIHLCHFYASRQEVIDILVPYFRFGLRNRERCIWITGAPLAAKEASAELAKHIRDFDKLCDADRLRVVDREEWFGAQRKADAQDFSGWLRVEESALAQGYAGLRIAGHLSCADSWTACMGCEAAASAALRGRRIVALCGFDGARCGPGQVHDVIRCHHETLHRSHGAWHILEQPTGAHAAADRLLRSMLGFWRRPSIPNA